jgi:hypothetical protein
MEGNFVKGEPDGVWMMWLPDGEATRITYDHGEEVSAEVIEKEK